MKSTLFALLSLISITATGVKAQTYHQTDIIKTPDGSGVGYVKLNLQSIVKRGNIVYFVPIIDVKKGGRYIARDIGVDKSAQRFNCSTEESYNTETSEWFYNPTGGFFKTAKFACSF